LTARFRTCLTMRQIKNGQKQEQRRIQGSFTPFRMTTKNKEQQKKLSTTIFNRLLDLLAMKYNCWFRAGDGWHGID
jgi:hypothetical protein